MHWQLVLRNARNSRSFTQKELAEKLGVNRNQIWRWESGLSFPDPINKRKIADFVGEDVQTLFKGES